jgi:hypothetical protein
MQLGVDGNNFHGMVLGVQGNSHEDQEDWVVPLADEVVSDLDDLHILSYKTVEAAMVPQKDSRLQGGPHQNVVVDLEHSATKREKIKLSISYK